jgi:antitoxin (DNA-binding transcriptional repressor) of toxin-antitoxin stability system
MARVAASIIRAHPDDYLEIVQRGGQVTIVEGEDVIAELVPTDEARRIAREVVRRLSEDDARALQPLFTDQQTPHSRIQHAIEVLRRTSEISEVVRKSMRGSIPRDFLTRKRPAFQSGSVLDALLEERQESRW